MLSKKIHVYSLGEMLIFSLPFILFCVFSMAYFFSYIFDDYISEYMAFSVYFLGSLFVVSTVTFSIHRHTGFISRLFPDEFFQLPHEKTLNYLNLRDLLTDQAFGSFLTSCMIYWGKTVLPHGTLWAGLVVAIVFSIASAFMVVSVVRFSTIFRDSRWATLASVIFGFTLMQLFLHVGIKLAG